MITPQQILRKELEDLRAYQVANTEGFIKLDAMENPYSLPASIQEQWTACLKETVLNRYPDPHAIKLKQLFFKTFKFSSNLELLFGNGSDELIQLMTLAIAKPDACILTVTPSFSMYKLIANYISVRVIEVPLEKNTFALQTNLICEQIKQNQPALIFLACPNNPTGTLWPLEEVEKIIQEATGLVVIDEAYTPFAAYSMMPLVERYSHALMLRTLSKMGLAGLRLGWLLGAKEWLVELNKLRLPYNINVLTQVSASFALKNINEFYHQADLICQQREFLINKMSEFDEIQVYPSEANFILFKTLNLDAQTVFEHMVENKIMIKNVADKNLLNNCLRVTVGTDQENQAFLAALKTALK